ncbi:MAG: L-serine ammonia-lyase [Comamonadaceae bacterium]|nr:MAG: L-serine ammonia-lyase [Comamonadaceae bacterium]
MTISVFDLFKVGIGPSSSHTVGPMRAAGVFLTMLTEQRVEQIDRFQIELFGSLGATGIGHATDRAVVMGLMGLNPETVDPRAAAPVVNAAFSEGVFHAPGLGDIDFCPDRDIAFHLQALPYHPNALTLHAMRGERRVATRTYYSVGGGFILDEAQAEATAAVSCDDGARREFDSAAASAGAARSESDSAAASAGGAQTDICGAVAARDVPYPFSTAQALLAQCKRHGLSISSLMMANEQAWAKEDEILRKLATIWTAMQACVSAGMQAQGELPGGLHVPRRARRLREAMLAPDAPTHDQGLAAMDWLNLYALAVNEENAAGGRVVTAPTNGAAGIVPAVLHYYMQFNPRAQPQDPARFLVTAAAIGILCKTNASISGAEVGCQGEVGSACAMAAAGLAEVMGGTPEQVENAAEIALEHNLGLTCDPIGGLVQIPCIERNAIGAVKAVNAAQMALRQDGQHMVSLDQVIQTMRDTGRDMSHKYKETSLGGLAVSVVAC